MKPYLLCLTLFFFYQALAQDTSYWQQKVYYTINAELDDKAKTITGFETLVYKNNSPDTLNFIWFHIYPNAYKNDSTALFIQLKNSKERSKKIRKNNRGYIDGLSFKVNGTAAKIEPHEESTYIDIVKLLLPQQLKPGDSIEIKTPFTVKLPAYFSRSGYEDGEFMACQWYPKPAVYDKSGWNEFPYLDMGEYYSEYGNYKVNITLPSEYIVGATGLLQTQNEIDLYKTIGKANAVSYDNKPQRYAPLAKGTKKTLTYIADSVLDFAWFADKDYIIQYDTLKLTSGRIIDAFTFFYYKKSTPWRYSLQYVKDAVKHYSNWLGEYEYPVVQAVEGPKNNMSGGMEYPTITLITSPDAKDETLDVVIAHEVGHNWFMGMLGSNEREHPWMDEGMNTYFQFRYQAEKYRNNEMLNGLKLPPEIKQKNPDEFLALVYNFLLGMPAAKSPIETASSKFTNDNEYGMVAYVKAAMWMYIIELSIGKDDVDKAFRYYFNTWKFKHPQPIDMKIAFEKAVGKGMNALFKLLAKEGKFE
jgi:Peptidase family M1 domain